MAATITVSTTATVNQGHTAVVKYQIGIVQGGQFQEQFSYSRNLTAGNNQSISNTFQGCSLSTQYTVKVSIKFDDLAFAYHTDRTITTPAA